MITRREIFLTLAGLAAARARVAGAPKEFWNEKDPGQWTPEEIELLLNQSPWARPANMSVTSVPEGFSPALGGTQGVSRSAGVTASRRGGVKSNGDSKSAASSSGTSQATFHAVVRWESALPIRTAEKNGSLEGISEFYILLAIGDFPSGDPNEAPSAREQRQAMLREFTKLERKGDSPIYLDRIEPIAAGLRFYFSRLEPIAAANREITFTTKMGPLEMKAKFPLKDMLYRGKLEL